MRQNTPNAPVIPRLVWIRRCPMIVVPSNLPMPLPVPVLYTDSRLVYAFFPVCYQDLCALWRVNCRDLEPPPLSEFRRALASTTVRVAQVVRIPSATITTREMEICIAGPTGLEMEMCVSPGLYIKSGIQCCASLYLPSPGLSHKQRSLGL